MLARDFELAKEEKDLREAERDKLRQELRELEVEGPIEAMNLQGLILQQQQSNRQQE